MSEVSSDDKYPKGPRPPHLDREDLWGDRSHREMSDLHLGHIMEIYDCHMKWRPNLQVEWLMDAWRHAAGVAEGMAMKADRLKKQLDEMKKVQP